MDGEGMWSGMVRFYLASILFAILLGGLLVWGVPEVWAWIKPFIHTVTA